MQPFYAFASLANASRKHRAGYVRWSKDPSGAVHSHTETKDIARQLQRTCAVVMSLPQGFLQVKGDYVLRRGQGTHEGS